MSCVDELSPCQESSCRARGVFSAKSYKNAGLFIINDYDIGEWWLKWSWWWCWFSLGTSHLLLFFKLLLPAGAARAGQHRLPQRGRQEVWGGRPSSPPPWGPVAITKIIIRSCGIPLASSLSPGLGASTIAQGFKKFQQILQFSNLNFQHSFLSLQAHCHVGDLW